MKKLAEGADTPGGDHQNIQKEPLSDDEQHDFLKSIRKARRNPNDFAATKVTERPPSGPGIYVIRGSMTITNKRTGRTCIYKTGQGDSLIAGGNDWIEDFREDLNAGEFD